MKYSTLLPIIIFLLSCSDNNLTEPEIAQYQIIAYESLTENEKSTITEDLYKATVEEGNYESNNGSHTIIIKSDHRLFFLLKDSEIELKVGQRLIAVSFNTKDDALLGPITVIISPLNNEVIGFVGRL